MPDWSPDRCLVEGLAACVTWEKAQWGSAREKMAAEAATRCFAELNEHLSRGGQLPRAWQDAGKVRQLRPATEPI